MNGPAIPCGSNTELMVERIPLLVNGVSDKDIRKEKASASRHHCTPRALSTISALLISFVTIVESLEDGMVLVTSVSLHANLVKLKPPERHSF